VENLNNPDPTQVVRWGDQTREEMMIGYFDVAIERSWSALSEQQLEQHVAKVKALDRFDANRNGRIEQSEVTPRWQERFRLLDQNEDRQVTFAELTKGSED
jgi:hypothetical protein